LEETTDAKEILSLTTCVQLTIRKLAATFSLDVQQQLGSFGIPFIWQELEPAEWFQKF